MGLWTSDPRLGELVKVLQGYTGLSKNFSEYGENYLSFEEFVKAIKNNVPLIKKAFTGDLIIPDFSSFCEQINTMYETCLDNKAGKVASYIPQLSRFNPNYWGVSVCTVDGQRFALGDVKVGFTLQSSSKPLSYALAVNELGSGEVHKYVGYEPSGESFNSIKLSPSLKPHNPMINSGAIVISSMIKSKLPLGERFDYLQNQYKLMAGGEDVSFNNSVYLSEKATANRNLALGYYLQEHNCFPPDTSLDKTLDFYFMSCSVEVNANTAAVMAATLANGGYCPLTNERVLSSRSVRNTLTLMHSCGMYDYSGSFSFKVGLPAKSSVSGCILLVVPNVMGLCLWSPPLDVIGNSVRGVQFCEQLIHLYNFHHYDSLLRSDQKQDPRHKLTEPEASKVINLLLAAYRGDFITLRRLALHGVNMGVRDYDQRSPLHIAAAEGHLECVMFLIDRCKVDVNIRDRWGRTALDDALHFKRKEVAEFLSKNGA